MNVLFAFLALTIAFSIGFTSYSQDLTKIPGATVTNSHTVIASVAQDSPAAKAGIEPGDFVEAFTNPVSGVKTGIKEVRSLADFTRAQRDAGVKTMLVTLERNGELIDKSVTFATEGYPLGISSQPFNSVRVPVYRAPQVAIKEMGFVFSLTWESLSNFGHRLFYKAQLDENVSGPIGIYQATASATRMGFNSTLFLMIALSLNLALLNILPIPALDGGKLLFLIIEGIFGKRAVNRKWESAISFAGFTILILLILILTVRDVVRLF
jgi:regulator of sigma E protease